MVLDSVRRIHFFNDGNQKKSWPCLSRKVQMSHPKPKGDGGTFFKKRY